MGLLTNYTDYNKVTDTALCVKYSVEQDSIRVTGWKVLDPESGVRIWTEYDKVFYRCRRFAQKVYRYVGMDYDTAIDCQTAKVQQYTRDYSKVAIQTTIDPVTEEETTEIVTENTTYCSSDISCEHVDGGMWQVVIVVNEEDEIPSDDAPSNIASLFTSQNNRDYDEPTKWRNRR